MADNVSITAEHIIAYNAMIGNPKKTIAVIDEMFMHFVRSEQYVLMTEDERNKFVDTVEELKLLFA